jgi:hypothetical protein
MTEISLKAKKLGTETRHMNRIDILGQPPKHFSREQGYRKLSLFQKIRAVAQNGTQVTFGILAFQLSAKEKGRQTFPNEGLPLPDLCSKIDLETLGTSPVTRKIK